VQPTQESNDSRILDAIPMMIFVVDDDVQIIDANAAALQVLGVGKDVILKRRGGDVLHCIHAQDVPEGCGRAPHCQTCLIRGSVQACLSGQGVTRRRTKAEIVVSGRQKDVELLVTANLLNAERRLAVLILEDITEISMLREIIPICSHCRRIRNDQAYWQSVEAYFTDHAGVDFSHGLCPECAQLHYPQFFGAREK